jgi:amino acid adenylation domain-containing protein
MNDLAKRIAELPPEKRKLLSQALQEKLLSQQLQNNKEGISQAQILPQERNTNVFPLSFAQWRLWFLNQWDPDSAWYNMPGDLHFSGPLHVEALKRSLVAVVQRHEALRTTFSTLEGQPVQVVAPDLAVQIPVIDLRGLRTGTERDLQVKQLARTEAQYPFDLVKGPLLRAFLLRTGKCPVPTDEQEHVLLFTLHHIVTDGWSMEVLVREMTKLYQAQVNGEPEQLPELPIQYVDYALWQRDWLQGEVLQSQLAYWRKQLADLSPLTLPTDHPRPRVQTGRGTSQSHLLPQVLLEELLRLCQRQDVTLFMLLLSAFQILLMRYTGQTDISVGTPVANRRLTELEDLIGCFVNTLVMRTDLSGNPTFLELLQRVREVCLGAYAHQDIPFEKVVEVLAQGKVPVSGTGPTERDLSRTPLFQVMFILQNTPVEQADLAGVSIMPLAVETTTSKFDLTLSLIETTPGLAAPGGLNCTLEYSTDLFEAETITRMLAHFQTLLEGVLQHPQALLSDLPLLTDVEREQLLVQWNATQTDYPQDKCLHQLFEQQAEETPEAVAAVFEDVACGFTSHLTYQQLNSQANQLASRLLAEGIGPDRLVGVCMERSLELVISLLAVLKAGGAYVPLDPNYPQDRLVYMLEDAQVTVVLTQAHLHHRLSLPKVELICIESGSSTSHLEHRDNPVSLVQPENLAYLLYTSGSTGKPKGVMIGHRNASAMIQWARHFFSKHNLAGVLASTSISFDLAVFELFVPLSAGGTVVLAENLLYLPAMLTASRVTLVNTVPSVLSEMLRLSPLPASVQTVNLAGEPLPPSLVQQLYQQETVQQVFNLYGPSEATTYSTVAPIGRSVSQSVPIGRPIANTQIYLLDSNLQPVPVGVPGELYIGGEGLARGYWRQPDLTAERFITNPFAGIEQSHDPRARLYRTGDLARYRADGAIEYLGRIDQQVKLRGFRIELGEIEATLRGHPAVQEAVVVLYEEDGDRKYLAAYVVPLEERPRPEELQTYLRQHLPDYMVPATFVYLEALPLTPNGKVNRKALPAPARTAQRFEGYTTSGYFVAPQSELEQRLAEIWQEVLGIQEQVSTTSNFFDLGGHSLLIIQVRSKLQAYLGYEVPVVDLFQYPTISTLSTYLSGRQEQQSLLQPLAERVRKRKGALSPKELSALEEGLAIVGLSGRFPGARNIDEFWQNLCNGVESISFFSEEELLACGVAPDLVHDSRYVKAQGILDDVEYFDAAFFGYSPREAASMDPQHRLFLECAWEVLEQAGILIDDSLPDTYQGLIGVYAGQSASSYLLNNLLANPTFLAENGVLSTIISNDKDFLATRTSYKLNFKGPSITIQTACSTSLVAVHMACQGLLRHECDMALAGGATIFVPQKAGYLYEEEGILSPDGHCRAFDADARGTVAGSGVGIVALKRLSDATADGDTIYAVIRGSAINNDGATKAGYTAPSVEGQAKVITEAIAMAGVEPNSISYVETHGTGTALGDPIEIAALTLAFRAVGTGLSPIQGANSVSTVQSGYCAIGSLKTNLGHLDAASGIAGLIKTVLSLKHGLIPPSLHFHRPNPKIDFAKTPFYVNTHLTAWKRGSTPRRAGVNSFGMGGTNAHIILEEAPPIPPLMGRSFGEGNRPVGTGVSLAHNSQPGNEKPLSALAHHTLLRGSDRPHLVVLSAKTASALETMTEQLATYVDTHPDAHLADIAYTLQLGRKSFPHRRAFVAQERTDLLHLLTTRDPQAVHGFSPYKNFQSPNFQSTDVVSPETKQVAFIFPGQGTQYVNMGRELYEEEPTFRDQLDTCANLLVPHLQRDLRKTIYPATEQESNSPDGNLALPLYQTDMTQPALFVIEYALARLLMKWGIHPQVMIGHSIGEYVAACLAGVFSLEDALALVALRGRLMQALPAGAMLAVTLSEKDVEKYLGSKISLAACNGTNESVVSGTIEAIELLEKQLTEKGISYRRLHTSHAFHSQMMDPILEDFTAEVSKIVLHPPKIPYISNITGTWITAQEATNPAYWAQHIRQTVRWVSGVQLLLDSPNMVLLEVGPGHALSTLARSMANRNLAQSLPPVILPTLRHPQTRVSDRAFLLNTCGRLWCAGVAIHWSQLYADEQRRRIPLPTYPFERERYWTLPVEAGGVGTGSAQGTTVRSAPAQDHQENASLQLRKEPDLARWFYTPYWKRSLSPAVGAGQAQGKGTMKGASPSPTPTAPTRKPCWLIFTDAVGLGTRLGEKLAVGTGLASDQEAVITVKAGTEFRSHWIEASGQGQADGDKPLSLRVPTSPYGPDDHWEYTLRPENQKDYEMLLKDMSSHGIFPTHIVHLWTVIATDHAPSGLDYFETAQALGFYSLLFLTQALGEQNVGVSTSNGPEPLEIALISNNLQEVIGGEVLCPVRATALGAGKVASREYPHITFRSIDIVLPATIGQAQGKEAVGTARTIPTPTTLEQLVDQISAELRRRSSDSAVAYRGLHRWIQCIEAVQLPEVAEEKLPPRPVGSGQAQADRGEPLSLRVPTAPDQRLRQQGTYLITGGLGGIGLTLAEYFAHQVQARLVLTGRTALPAREEWDRRLAMANEQDAVASKIRQVKRLEELGAEVLVIEADVADLEQMQAVISQVRQHFGDLHGVIHTAGTPGGGLIQLKTPEMAAGILAPKVKGTLVLEAVLKDLPLDFIVLCSSLATLTAEVGQVDYCAANTFLDTFAFYHTVQQSVRTLSINWDAWQEVGMTVNSLKIYKDALGHDLEVEKYLQHGMSTQEGIEVFKRALSYDTTSQVLVSTIDIVARLKQVEAFHLSKLQDGDGRLAPLSVSGASRRPNLQTPYVPPQNETQQQIADLWQKLLGIEKIGIHDNFLDFGGHSLLGTQLITRLRDTFQVDIPLRTFFEDPTVAHLAIVIVQKMAELVDDALLLQDIEDIEQLTDDEAQTFLAVDMKHTGME